MPQAIDPADAYRLQLEKHRERLCDGAAETQNEQDKAVMTLAGGGLGIALGFVRTPADPAMPLAFAVACVSFTASLVAVVFSFRASGAAFEAELAKLDANAPRSNRREPLGGAAGTRTKRLNAAALTSLVVGIVSLALFVLVNLGRHQS